MKVDFPSYSKLFNLTRRRLFRLKKIAENHSETLNQEDEFLFMMMGNLNLRLNTIFSLLENDITDGVYPLQRSFYELQLAFKSYIEANNRQDFIEWYLKKKNIETSLKWDRLVNDEQSDSEVFTDDEKKQIRDYKTGFFESGKRESKGQRITRTWFEIASGENTERLSYHYYSKEDYFRNYDEPSNWVHLQRLGENLSPVDFNQYLPDNYLKMLLNDLIWDINELTEDMLYLVGHFKICKSNQFGQYGKHLCEFQKSLVEHRKKFDNEKEGG